MLSCVSWIIISNDMGPRLKCVLVIDDDVFTNFLNNIIIDHAGIADHVQQWVWVESALSYLSSGLKKQPGFPLPDLIFPGINLGNQPGWKFID